MTFSTALPKESFREQHLNFLGAVWNRDIRLLLLFFKILYVVPTHISFPLFAFNSFKESKIQDFILLTQCSLNRTCGAEKVHTQPGFPWISKGVPM